MWRYFTKHQTWRYIDVLQDFVQSYNDTPHRNIGMAPSQVSAKNQEEVWQRLYGPGDTGVCRIACASVRSRDCSKKDKWRIGAKRSSRYTRFITPTRPCTDWSTISVKWWTEPSMNRSCRRCRYPPIKCTVWNRYCSGARWADERRLW